MRKKKYIILWTVCAFLLLGLALSYLFWGRYIGQETRVQPRRMREVEIVESTGDYYIMIDTETGCYYLFNTEGGVCQMTKYDGSPYLANGWRDIG